MSSRLEKLREFKQWLDDHTPDNPKDVYRSSLQESNETKISYVLYRWIKAVLHSLLMLASWLDVRPSRAMEQAVKPESHDLVYYGKWLLYFPSWMMLANTLQSIVGAVVVTLGFSRRSDGDVNVEERRAPVGVSWVWLFNIASTLSFYVGIASGLMGLFGKRNFVENTPSNMIGPWTGTGVFFMLVDLFVVRLPYYLLNPFTTGVLAAYFAMTWVHYKIGALDRYTLKPKPLLDWVHPQRALLSFVFSVAIMQVASAVLFGLYQVRREFITREAPTQPLPATQPHSEVKPTMVDHPQPTVVQPEQSSSHPDGSKDLHKHQDKKKVLDKSEEQAKPKTGDEELNSRNREEGDKDTHPVSTHREAARGSEKPNKRTKKTQ